MARFTANYNLIKIYLELAKEWYLTKNGQLTRYELTSERKMKVWLVYSQSREWITTIHNS
jgi:hypothetical protein